MKKLLTTLILMSMTVGSIYAHLDFQSDEIKEEALKYEKEGWKTKPGGLTIEDQLTLINKLEHDKDNKGNQKWQMGSAKSVGRVYESARMQALTLAKADVPNTVAKVINKGVKERKLVNVRVIFDVYRKLPNGNYQVFIRVAVPVTKKIR